MIRSIAIGTEHYYGRINCAHTRHSPLSGGGEAGLPRLRQGVSRTTHVLIPSPSSRQLLHLRPCPSWIGLAPPQSPTTAPGGPSSVCPQAAFCHEPCKCAIVSGVECAAGAPDGKLSLEACRAAHFGTVLHAGRGARVFTAIPWAGCLGSRACSACLGTSAGRQTPRQSPSGGRIAPTG